MKAGDKIYCIKNIIYNDKLHFIKDKEYLICRLYDDGEIVLFSEINEVSFKYPEAPDYDNIILFSSEYYINKSIFDYFITKQQYRKIKLEKINGR